MNIIICLVFIYYDNALPRMMANDKLDKMYFIILWLGFLLIQFHLYHSSESSMYSLELSPSNAVKIPINGCSIDDSIQSNAELFYNFASYQCIGFNGCNYTCI